MTKQLFVAYQRGLDRVLDATEKRVISDVGIERILSVKEISTILSQSVKQTAMNAWNTSILYGLQDTEEAYGKQLPIVTKKSEEIIKITTEEFQDLGLGDDIRTLENEALKSITTVSRNYRGVMESTFKNALNIGASREDLIETLRSSITELGLKNKYIAQRIAQTETTRIYAGGSTEGYKKSTVVKGKGWSSNLMGNPRPAHIAANGQEVDIDKPFIVMGESLEYPGDPNGSPENVINCHCGTYPVIHPSSNKPVSPASEEGTPASTRGTPSSIETPETPSAGETISREKLETLITSNDIESITPLGAGQGGVNETVKIKIKGDGEVAFKPVSGEADFITRYVGGNLYSRERAAYLICEKLEMDNVPVTVIRKSGEKIGSAQQWVTSGKVAKDVPWMKDYPWGLPKKAPEWAVPEYEKMKAFDVLISNSDRHYGNYLIDEVNKKFIYIDNGFSMYTTNDHMEFDLYSFISSITKMKKEDVLKFKTNLPKLRTPEFKKVLKENGLNSGAINRFFKNVKAIEEEMTL
jgi:hypothetical protein